MYPFEIIVLSANTCALKPMHIHKVWMSQLESNNIAIAMCQETRDQWSGMKQVGKYLVIASAANQMGSYGCRVMFNLDVAFARKCKGPKMYLKRQHVTIIESAPRYLIVAIHAPSLDTIVVSAHAPHSADKDGPIWWSCLSERIRYHLKARQLIIGIDANIDIMRPCEPHVGDIVSDNKAEPK